MYSLRADGSFYFMDDLCKVTVTTTTTTTKAPANMRKKDAHKWSLQRNERKNNFMYAAWAIYIV